MTIIEAQAGETHLAATLCKCLRTTYSLALDDRKRIPWSFACALSRYYSYVLSATGVREQALGRLTVRPVCACKVFGAIRTHR